MRIAVIGAAGKVGRLTVAAAAVAGHEAVAVARDPSRVPEVAGPGSVRRAAADVLDPEGLHRALADVDAVIATFGAPLTLDTVLHVPDLCERGTRNLLAAMVSRDIRRLVCMTAIGVGDSKGHGRWIFRHVIQPALLQRIFEDRERQEALVRDSLTRWTIVRPAELTDGPAAPVRAVEIGTGNDPEPTTIARASVAGFLVRELELDAFVGRSPVISE